MSLDIECSHSSAVQVTALTNSKQAPQVAWEQAKLNYQAALSEYDRLSHLAAQATAAVDADAPFPDILIRPNGKVRDEEEIMRDQKLSLTEKLTMIEALRDWRAAYKIATERHGYDDAHDAVEIYEGRNEALEALLNTAAPDLVSLSWKMRIWLKEGFCSYLWQDVDHSNTIASLLTDSTYDGSWPATRIYQDILRLTGQKPDLASTEPFDVEEWTAAFEALPGHTVTDRGPCFMEPEAWGPGCPEARDFRISDPIAIANVQHKLTALAWDRNSDGTQSCRAEIYFAAQPHLVDREAIDWAFPHDQTERMRLHALWERRINHMKGQPLGRGRWQELTDWQQTAVIEFARRRRQ